MRIWILFTLVLLLVRPVFAAEGMLHVKSGHDVATTQSRLVEVLESKGMTVFAQISHSEGAAGVGIELRPTQLVIFGNPKVGAPLMACQQSVAIDLPQKMLIWADIDGIVWLSYNDPSYLAERHQIEGCDAILDKISAALAGFSSAAAN